MHFVRTSALIVVAAVTAITSNLTGISVEAKPNNGCKYWCKDGKKYYCCSNIKKSNEVLSWVMQGMSSLHNYFWLFDNPWPILIQQATTFDWMPQDYNPPYKPHEKKGTCPEIRPVCPRFREWNSSPTRCNTDEECYYLQKFYYDMCLDHKTCKPSIMTDATAEY